MSIEQTILSNLVYNEAYGRKVIPFLKDEYFSDVPIRTVYQLIDAYVKQYNAFPSKEALAIDLSNRVGTPENVFKSSKDIVESLSFDKDTQVEWLVTQTEKFCQEKAVYNAIMSSIQILDDRDGKISKGAIPQILSDALGVSFDTNIGHDFIEDADARYEFYHTKENRIPFDLDYLNKITGGGLPNKTLNIILAGTGVGKSLMMCHMSAANLMVGKNVLYITMEMAEERISERVDANLLDVPLDQLKVIPKDIYDKKMDKIRKKTQGKLIVKEYPTASVGSANFRHLLNELKLKKKFVPDIIYIDYLNICTSSRIKHGAQVNSYTLIKAIAEELRGLAVEFNVPVVSATQTTRSGYSSSDLELGDTSESFGLPATADFMFGISTSEKLDELGQIMVKQLKNRYGDPSTNRRFVVGVDRSRMRLYDVEQSAQDDIMEDRPVMDNGHFMTEDTERNKPRQKFTKDVFAGFK
ncbi:41 helicase [uncultured Caudovirales phage]|jgi:archaellum biogenesis ATPase FlaH|uniref:DnaB-like replicative helicase n=1 Tax=uncultured Caudovirales phage TaxID=2100421 RepID=A0A6J5LES2_9CAUD|nr:41 helicase [uncultured Caudovirales phage]